jgi:SHS2 domain-containing protein
MTFKYLAHTADVKILASAPTLEKVFSSSAMALKDVVLRREKIKVAEKIKKHISVSGKDNESLLYNFLEEFLYLLDAENFLVSKINKIKICDEKLEAEISGDEASNYKFSNEVKAITYNEMFVKKEKGNFMAQFVLDV